MSPDYLPLLTTLKLRSSFSFYFDLRNIVFNYNKSDTQVKIAHNQDLSLQVNNLICAGQMSSYFLEALLAECHIRCVLLTNLIVLRRSIHYFTVHL